MNASGGRCCSGSDVWASRSLVTEARAIRRPLQHCSVLHTLAACLVPHGKALEPTMLFPPASAEPEMQRPGVSPEPGPVAHSMRARWLGTAIKAIITVSTQQSLRLLYGPRPQCRCPMQVLCTAVSVRQARFAMPGMSNSAAARELNGGAARWRVWHGVASSVVTEGAQSQSRPWQVPEKRLLRVPWPRRGWCA